MVSLEEAERQDAPVVGYLAYDHVARLEPTVPLPADGPSYPESRFIVADTLVRFDHAAGLAEVLCGDPDELRARLDAPRAAAAARPGKRGADTPVPRPRRVRALGREARRSTSARATPSRSSLSQRAERPTSASAVELYRTLRRVNPSPYLFLLELGDAGAGRLVAGDAGQGRGAPGEPEPDRRDDRSPGRATRSACSHRRRTAPST